VTASRNVKPRHSAIDDEFVLEHVSRYAERSTREIFESVVADYGYRLTKKTIERRLVSLRERGRIVITRTIGPDNNRQNFYRRPKP